MPTISCLPPLPGFRSPLNHIPQGDSDDCALFPNALDPDLVFDDRICKARMPVLTLREIAMVQYMNQITDKCDWEHKVFDDAIVQKWKTEALQTPDFSQEMVDYCIEELKYTAELYAKTGILRVYSGDVVKSDVAIPTDLQVALKAAIAPLENVPARKQDWHPGSGNKVLDLVHPSLFPLVYGLSHILNNRNVGTEDCIYRCGQGEVIPEPPQDQASIKKKGDIEMTAVYSRKFQWLPCDVDISGNTSKILSYINNLHPQDHADLYGIIEKIIEKVIPLWNATLTPLRNYVFPRRIVYKEIDFGDLDNYAEKSGPKRLDGENEDDFWYRLEDWKDLRKNEFIVRPNPPTFIRPETEVEEEDTTSKKNHESQKRRNVDLKANNGPTGLQIIVKLANIHLTPEKPEYEGDTWHVEERLNEHICATAIYYYDSENITSSHLAFRQRSEVFKLEEDISYEEEGWTWLEAVYGLRYREPAVQVVGSVEAREHRVVTFPNILQHQVRPFKLADPTKPGHQKILTLFLVDPNIRIISTANVPCQQRNWWGRILTSSGNALERLPTELSDKIINDVEDFPVSLERAKQLREELMAETKPHAIDFETGGFNGVMTIACP